jgi:hypothetical protein
MKYVLEFGVRGGAHADNVVIPTRKLAEKLAANMVFILSNSDGQARIQGDMFSSTKTWKLTPSTPRVSWQSSTHFVSLSILDGVARGPAAAKLWKREQGDSVNVENN